MPDDLDVEGTEAEAAVTGTETAEDLEVSDGSTALEGGWDSGQILYAR